jgi:hypothetical protein
MRKFAIATIIFILVGSSEALAQDAPIGLTWMASEASLKQAGIELKETGNDSYGVGYTASKLPKALADQQMTLLSFGHNDKLWRIVIISKEFTDDPMGVAVRNRYDQLIAILSEKYGRPKTHQTLGDSIYAEQKYFLAGVRGGNSFWYSNFDTTQLFIQMGIVASSNSEARWRIIYEYKPLKAIFERDKRSEEKGNL